MENNNSTKTVMITSLVMLVLLDVGLVIFVGSFWAELQLLPLPFAPMPPSSQSVPRISTGDIYVFFIFVITSVILFGFYKTRQFRRDQDQ